MPPVTVRCDTTWRTSRTARACPAGRHRAARACARAPSAVTSTKNMSTTRARAHRGHDRDALGRGADQLARLAVERRHQFALGEPQQIGAVDDVAEMRLSFAPGRGRDAATGAVDREQVAQQRRAPASRSSLARISAARGAQMGDRRQPRQAGDFAHHNDGERKPPPGPASASPSQPSHCERANRSSISLVTASPERQRNEPAQGRPEQLAPGKRAASAAPPAAVPAPRAARAPPAAPAAPASPAAALARLVARHRDDHVRIVEARRRRACAASTFAHCSRSPIRNCSARSRRIWGRTPAPFSITSRAGGSAGSDNRRPQLRRAVEGASASNRRSGSVRQIARIDHGLGFAVENLLAGAFAGDRNADDRGQRVAAGAYLRLARRPHRGHRDDIERAPAKTACAPARSVIRRRMASSRSWLA